MKKGLAFDLKFSRCRRFTCHIMPALTALAIGALGIMVVDRNPPVNTIWGKVVPPIVRAGQDVTFHFGAIKRVDYGGVFTRWVVDAAGVVYTLTDTPTVSDKLTVGKEIEIVKKFPVPCGISIGPAEYHSRASVYTWWNIVQRFFWPISVEIKYPFIVEPGSYDGKCSFGQRGEQGIPGPQGPRGENAPAPK